jgi:hypothetical protein
VLALRELRAWSGQRNYYEVASYYHRLGGAANGTRLAKSTLYDALNPNREHLPPLVIRGTCRGRPAKGTKGHQVGLEGHHRHARSP